MAEASKGNEETSSEQGWKGQIRGLFAGALLSLQCFVSTWRLADVRGKYCWFWLLSLTPLATLGACRRYFKGKQSSRKSENTDRAAPDDKGTPSDVKQSNAVSGAEIMFRKFDKRVSLTFFFFLISAVPPILCLELERFKRHNAEGFSNRTNQKDEPLSPFLGLEIPIKLKPDTWIIVLEQTLMMFLTPVRFLVPKKKLVTKRRFSELLVTYIAIASDIVELFDMFEYKEVMNSLALYVVVLIAWPVSLLQFIIDHPISPKKGELPFEQRILFCTLVLQDVPFLLIRFWILVRYGVNKTILFFFMKNLSVVVVGLYHLYSNFEGKKEKETDPPPTEKPKP